MLQNQYIKFSFIAGFICGLLIFLYFFTFYLLHKNPLIHMSTFDILIVFICMAVAMAYYRNKYKAGKLHFWEAVIIGLLTNLIGTFISTVAIYIFISFIDPAVLNRHIADLNQILIQTKQQVIERFGNEAFENTLQRLSGTTSFNIALDIFIKKFAACFLATGIIAAILRKN